MLSGGGESQPRKAARARARANARSAAAHLRGPLLVVRERAEPHAPAARIDARRVADRPGPEPVRGACPLRAELLRLVVVPQQTVVQIGVVASGRGASCERVAD